MKKMVQPKFYTDVEVTCACGAVLVTGSVLPGPLKVEICSNCHPFFTGEKKLVDTEGRVDKYMRLREQAEKAQEEQKVRNEAKVKVQPREPQKRKSLREMLQDVS